MGPFDAGQEVEIRLTIVASGDNGRYLGSNEYIMVRKNSGFNFYYLDQQTFEEDIKKLQQNTWEIDMKKSNDRYLTGEIDIADGQILSTSIPYEPGWKIKVDGKTVNNLVVEEKDANGKL